MLPSNTAGQSIDLGHDPVYKTRGKIECIFALYLKRRSRYIYWMRASSSPGRLINRCLFSCATHNCIFPPENTNTLPIGLWTYPLSRVKRYCCFFIERVVVCISSQRVYLLEHAKRIAGATQLFDLFETFLTLEQTSLFRSLCLLTLLVRTSIELEYRALAVFLESIVLVLGDFDPVSWQFCQHVVRLYSAILIHWSGFLQHAL